MSRAKPPPHRHGLLLIDKPAEMTSHDVVAVIRRLAGQKRVGHTGTLDPMATGLMAVLLGSATRLEPYLVGMGKTYSGQMALGLSTDSDDITGLELSRHFGPWPEPDIINQALAGFEGERDQVPPAFSAIKVAGRRSYKAARAGEPLELPARRVTAHRLKVTAYQPPLVDFKAEVSSGYYIRSLARDLGLKLGLGGAALTALRREKVGPWTLDQAFPLEQLRGWGEYEWREKITPPAQALPEMKAVTLDGEKARLFALGQKVSVPAEEPGTAKVLNPLGELIGLGELTKITTSLGGDQPPGPYLRPLRVFETGRN